MQYRRMGTAWSLAFALLSTATTAKASPSQASDAGVNPLSPAAAARAAVAPASTEQPTTAPDERSLADDIPELVRASRASAAQKGTRAVETVVWTMLAPWKRQPRASAPVRYWFIGHSFDADILQDGSVTFRAKEGFVLSPVAIRSLAGALPVASSSSSGGTPSDAIGSPTQPGVGTGVAQPGRVASRLATGKEPANEELHAFLERTKPLRELLEAKERAIQLERAKREVEEALSRLWNRVHDRSELGARIFALWDACSDDEIGERGRSLIEAFLRDHQGTGPCLFTTQHLETLNHKRKARRSFQPCSTDDAPNL
jgi:hypothetical protein